MSIMAQVVGSGMPGNPAPVPWTPVLPVGPITSTKKLPAVPLEMKSLIVRPGALTR